MKNWKKLLLCVALSVLVSVFIGTTLSVINNRIIVYMVVAHEDELKESMYPEIENYVREIESKYLDNKDEEVETKKEDEENVSDWENPPTTYTENNENKNIKESNEDLKTYMSNLLQEDRIRNMASMYGMTAGVVDELYLFSIIIGIVTGILIYLIFVKQVKAKKLILISVICFAGLFLIFNIGDIISDIIDGTFELSITIDRNEGLNVFMIVYIIIFAVLYGVNLIHQKKLANKLNIELNKENK